MADKSSPAKSTASDSTKSSASSTESTGASSSDTSTSSSTTSKGGGGGSRPISYFSSVSTDEYRSGWNEIFGSKPAVSAKKTRPVKPKKAEAVSLPIAIDLDDSDLNGELRALLTEALKKKRESKSNLGRALTKSGVRLQVSCEISD